MLGPLDVDQLKVLIYPSTCRLRIALGTHNTSWHTLIAHCNRQASTDTVHAGLLPRMRMRMRLYNWLYTPFLRIITRLQLAREIMGGNRVKPHQCEPNSYTLRHVVLHSLKHWNWTSAGHVCLRFAMSTHFQLRPLLFFSYSIADHETAHYLKYLSSHKHSTISIVWW